MVGTDTDEVATTWAERFPKGLGGNGLGFLFIPRVTIEGC